MSTETTIDWECWHLQEPPPEFVDRVMAAVLAESHGATQARRPRGSARWIGIMAAAALGAGSLTALATFGRRAGRGSTSTMDAAQSPNNPPASAKSGGGMGARSTFGRVPPAERAAGTVVDRTRRDAVRAQLVPALEGQGIERDPHTGLTIPAGASGPSHDLSEEYLNTRIREDFYPLARACYESALAKLPTLRGKIVVDFMIVGDAKAGGIVDQVKINDRTDIADAEFTGCIRESMLSMVFAPPANNGWMTVTYPFHFAPGDDDEALPREE
jgi:hypothetical protein